MRSAIALSVPAVQGLLAGSKTRHTKALRPRPERTEAGFPWKTCKGSCLYRTEAEMRASMPLDFPIYEVGMPLSVREMWRPAVRSCDGAVGIEYRADGHFLPLEAARSLVVDDRWCLPLRMPGWASRITIVPTGLWLRRLQETTEEEARAEGNSDLEEFVRQWDRRARPWLKWADDPLVWVVSWDRLWVAGN
jgi:hypothetical protein